MSVIVADRKPSKREVVTHIEAIEREVDSLLARNLGVKNLDVIVRVSNGYSSDPVASIETRRAILSSLKCAILAQVNILAKAVRDSWHHYPSTLHEYELRRNLQTQAIVECNTLKDILQDAANRLDVDINSYKTVIKSIDDQKELLKKWRQNENKIRNRL